MKSLLLFLILFLPLTSLAKTDPMTVYSMVKEGKAVIVDVREKEEIAGGMINRALWFPESKTREDKTWVEDFKKLSAGKPAFLYCRSGRRSGNMAETLNKSGQTAESIGGFEELKAQLPSHIPKGQ